MCVRVRATGIDYWCAEGMNPEEAELTNRKLPRHTKGRRGALVNNAPLLATKYHKPLGGLGFLNERKGYGR